MVQLGVESAALHTPKILAMFGSERQDRKRTSRIVSAERLEFPRSAFVLGIRATTSLLAPETTSSRATDSQTIACKNEIH